MAATPELTRPRRALLSCTDKSGLADIATVMHSYGYEFVASGGTARMLADHGIRVTPVSALTGYPEIFGGRVKTLHPAIHGGILAPREEDFAEVAALGVSPLDVVCVNLYRFAEAVRAGGDEAAIVEQIDIGGPALLRAAAKNFARVTVLSSPEDYEEFMFELRKHDGAPSLEFRRRMAAAAFARVADYDQAIAAWFGGDAAPMTLELRYGENPHQGARVELPPAAPGTPAASHPLASCGLRQWGGKDLSYNNLVDLVAALKLVGDFDEDCCAVIKHTNPCGFGIAPTPRAALERALAVDPDAAFGGVFAFAGEVDPPAAELLASRFFEIVAAPAYTGEALAMLRRKKNVRVLTVDRARFAAATRGQSRGFGGLVLRQDEDEGFPELTSWSVAAGADPAPQARGALTAAWRVCKHVKSNAVVIGDAGGLLGVGAGQMSRVDAARLAVRKAQERGFEMQGAVAASDGFFPFPDGLELLADAGVKAVIAPGGSIRDDEVSAAARARGVTLILVQRRHFRH